MKRAKLMTINVNYKNTIIFRNIYLQEQELSLQICSSLPFPKQEAPISFGDGFVQVLVTFCNAPPQLTGQAVLLRQCDQPPFPSKI